MMNELLYPKDVSINEIFKKKSFSAKNFAKIDIPNKNKESLEYYLNKKSPYLGGEEPGGFTYVPQSNVSFIRNSCINSLNYSHIVSKEIFLNPKYSFINSLNNDDILLCKDANIGDSCIFIASNDNSYIFSSGIVKLNPTEDELKYYLLAFIRDSYFQAQLDSVTPKGSIIRHAGDKFLKCLIPKITAKEEQLFNIIGSLIKNIAYAERISYNKLSESNSIINKELIKSSYVDEDSYINDIITFGRIDAGYYSNLVNTINFNIKNFPAGYSSLKDYGFIIKRGPNLQKRDLGRSIKSNDYHKNYHLLVYPSDISDNGFIEKEIYIGARNPVWYLNLGDILFSAEGTVGKVFIICNEEMKFITNIHGIIISPKSKNISLEKSIFLGQFLHYLKSSGYFDKISVGGQGGSLAVNYWEKLVFPKVQDNFMKTISKLYHNGKILDAFDFNILRLEEAGVFELNNFRIKCSELLKKIIKDIKNSRTEEANFYREYLM